MFLPRITVRFAKWRWNRWASCGVVNEDRSKVVFFRISKISSTTGRFPLLLGCSASLICFCLLPLLRCGLDLLPLVPAICASSLLFPLLPVEVGSARARFGAMAVWFGVEVFREDGPEGSRTRRGSRMEDRLAHGYFVKMKKKEDEWEWLRDGRPS